MSKPILYAKAGGPPLDWRKLKVFDGDKRLERCREVNVTEGWAVVAKTKGGGSLVEESFPAVTFERLESANLRIERMGG